MLVVRTELCFRKIHGPNDEAPGTSKCRGLIHKEEFPSAASCCNSQAGVAYSTELVSSTVFIFVGQYRVYTRTIVDKKLAKFYVCFSHIFCYAYKLGV